MSALQHPSVIDAYIKEECDAGRVLGPFAAVAVPAKIQVSRFGVIPKPHKPDSWRLILDLSSPAGASVNDGVDCNLSSLSYVSVEDIAEMVLAMGRGVELAKIDIRSAYRLVPVHPSDRALLGMHWRDAIYIDATLPFGLRSAPKIFTAVADALEWILRARGLSRVYHYLDDFLILTQPGDGERELRLMCSTCQELDVPLAMEKKEGPATCLEFLGIEIDTVALELRLPRDKLLRVKELVESWRGRKMCRLRELQSLVGSLQHACKVVRPGRSFVRRMHELLKRSDSTAGMSAQVRLNRGFQADIEWWSAFLEEWNGVSMLCQVRAASPDVEFWIDASGSWGCGAVWGGQWLQLHWIEGSRSTTASIAVKEFLPVVLACIVWGREWTSCTVCCHCDNEAVVSVINSRYARDPLLAHLLRCLFFISARYQFTVVARHTPGAENGAADAISRNNLSFFFAQVPRAAAIPTPIPPEAVMALANESVDWLSRNWTRLFVFILNTV